MAETEPANSVEKPQVHRIKHENPQVGAASSKVDHIPDADYTPDSQSPVKPAFSSTGLIFEPDIFVSTEIEPQNEKHDYSVFEFPSRKEQQVRKKRKGLTRAYKKRINAKSKDLFGIPVKKKLEEFAARCLSDTETSEQLRVTRKVAKQLYISFSVNRPDMTERNRLRRAKKRRLKRKKRDEERGQAAAKKLIIPSEELGKDNASQKKGGAKRIELNIFLLAWRHVVDGLHQDEIAKPLGVSGQTVAKRLDEIGLLTRRPPGRPLKPEPFDVNLAINLFLDGDTQVDMTRKLKSTRDIVRNRIGNAGYSFKRRAMEKRRSS